MQYRPLLRALHAEGTTLVDKAREFDRPSIAGGGDASLSAPAEALAAWQQVGRRGIVVLPTGAGKTYVAQLAMQATQRSTLVVVPTLDLMHQWYAHLLAAFPDASVGLLGGGHTTPPRSWWRPMIVLLSMPRLWGTNTPCWCSMNVTIFPATSPVSLLSIPWRPIVWA